MKALRLETRRYVVAAAPSGSLVLRAGALLVVSFYVLATRPMETYEEPQALLRRRFSPTTG